MAAKSSGGDGRFDLQRFNREFDEQFRQLQHDRAEMCRETSGKAGSLRKTDIQDPGDAETLGGEAGERGATGLAEAVANEFRDRPAFGPDYDSNVQILREQAQREADAVCGSVRVNQVVNTSGSGGGREFIEFERVVIHVRAAVKLVLRAGAEPFCDAFGILRLRRPQALAEDASLPPADGAHKTSEKTGDRGAWPIRSRQTLAWIANLCHEQAERPLTNRELDQVLLILEGKALENVRNQELDDVIECEPVLAMLMILFEKHRAWSGTATELLAALCDLAEQQGIGIEHNEHWPKNGGHLTMTLRGFQVWFEQAGIQYEYKRHHHQRIHVLTAATPPSSPAIPCVTNELQTSDEGSSPSSSGSSPTISL